VALGEHGVKTLDDLADLAGDELMEIAPEGTLKLDRANEIIMAARAHWFADEQTDAGDVADEAPAGPQEG
jgi:N utilization substance protein A